MSALCDPSEWLDGLGWPCFKHCQPHDQNLYLIIHKALIVEPNILSNERLWDIDSCFLDRGVRTHPSKSWIFERAKGSMRGENPSKLVVLRTCGNFLFLSKIPRKLAQRFSRVCVDNAWTCSNVMKYNVCTCKQGLKKELCMLSHRLCQFCSCYVVDTWKQDMKPRHTLCWNVSFTNPLEISPLPYWKMPY